MNLSESSETYRISANFRELLRAMQNLETKREPFEPQRNQRTSENIRDLTELENNLREAQRAIDLL